MLVPFESLPDHSRLWIYQANRKLSSEEIHIISDKLSAFTSSWAAHGVPLRASFSIRYDQILILAADEQVHPASGCSIDDSVRVVREVSEHFNVDLFNRTLIAFLVDGQVLSIGMAELRSSLESGIWNAESIVINNLVNTKGALDKLWLVPAGTSWLKRYLPVERLAG